MKKLLLPALLALPLLASAQTTYGIADISNEIYRAANSPAARSQRGQELLLAPAAYLVFEAQPGVLILNNNQRVRHKGLRLNVALQLLEARDTLGVVRLLPPGSIRGFETGTGMQLRRFRSQMVREAGTNREFVEELSTGGPMLLAIRHSYLHEDAEIDPILRVQKRAARDVIVDKVLAGPITMPETPLRPLTLKEKNVLSLFGGRAGEMYSYAMQQHLQLTVLNDVLRLINYYNETAAK